MKSNTADLTNGGILKKLLVVAVPIMGTQFVQMMYNLTDMFWLGQTENATMAVAASGMAGMFLWLSQAFIMVGRMGAEIGVAQNLGRGDRETAKCYAQNAFTLSIILGVLYGLIILFFADPILRLFSIQEAEVVSSAVAYMRLTGIGIPATFLSASLTGMLTGAGSSRRSFLANLIGLGINMALDPLFILGLNMGVEGAAIATIIGQWMVCIVFIYLSYHKKTRIFEKMKLWVRVNKAIAKDILKWSLPIVLESGLFTLLAMVVADVNATFGQGAIAVQKVGSQIESLSWLIGGGFGSAVTAFVGQNYGAGKWTRIRAGFKISMRIMLVWGIFVTVLLIFGGQSLMYPFLRQEPEVLKLGSQYLKILSTCQLCMCVEAVCSGAFRGMGKTMLPSLLSIVSNIARVPLVYYLVGRGMGLHGIWWGITATAILRGVAIFIWYLISQRRQPKVDVAVMG